MYDREKENERKVVAGDNYKDHSVSWAGIDKVIIYSLPGEGVRGVGRLRKWGRRVMTGG